MIFSPKMVQRINAGRKTMTRRPITDSSGRSRYRVGYDYAVQPGRGRPSLFRVKILSASEERVGDITLGDARAEGFRTTDEFKAYWVRLHDGAWVHRELVDLAEVFDDDVSVVDWILCERFRRSHAHKRVHVLRFEVLRDPSRYMATQRDILSGRSDGSYTTNPRRAIDEAECPPDPAEAARARAEGERRRETFREDLEAERARRKRARIPALRRAA